MLAASGHSSHGTAPWIALALVALRFAVLPMSSA
jgi:uncharacterized protein (TIGR03382 family)